MKIYWGSVGAHPHLLNPSTR